MSPLTLCPNCPSEMACVDEGCQRLKRGEPVSNGVGDKARRLATEQGGRPSGRRRGSVADAAMTECSTDKPSLQKSVREIGCVMRVIAGCMPPPPWKCRHCGITDRSRGCQAKVGTERQQ